MNKKFLSAILFGALMVSSTGTFVSCKDYDDEIDEINATLTDLKSQIAALQTKVDNGDYVTGVTKTADGKGMTFTFSKGSPVTVTLDVKDGATGEAGKDGSIVTVDEKTGELLIDGEGTNIFPAKDAAKAPVKAEGGFWYTLDEKGEYVNTNIPVSGMSVTGSDLTGYTLTVYNADGTTKVVKLPTAASALKGIELVGNGYFTNWAAETTATAAAESNLYDGGIKWGKASKAIDWKGGKGAIAKDALLVGQISTQKVTVVPATYNLVGQTLTLVASDGSVAPATVVATPETKDYAEHTDGRAVASGKWILSVKMGSSVTTGTIGSAFTTDSKNLKYALAVNGSVMTDYEFVIDTQTNDESNGNTKITATASSLKYAGKGISSTDKLPVGESTLVYEDAMAYDSYLSFEGTNIALAKVLGITVDGMKVNVPAAAANTSEELKVTVHVIDVTGAESTATQQLYFKTSTTSAETIAETTYKVMPLDRKNLVISLGDILDSMSDKNAESVKNSNQIAVSVKGDGNAAKFAFAVTAAKYAKVMKADGVSIKDEYKADADDVRDMKYIVIDPATIQDGAEAGKYTLVLTIKDGAAGNEIKKIEMPVSITLPAFTEIFEKSGAWNGEVVNMNLDNNKQADFTTAYKYATSLTSNMSVDFDKIDNKVPAAWSTGNNGQITITPDNMVSNGVAKDVKAETKLTIGGKLVVKSGKYTMHFVAPLNGAALKYYVGGAATDIVITGATGEIAAYVAASGNTKAAGLAIEVKGKSYALSATDVNGVDIKTIIGTAGKNDAKIAYAFDAKAGANAEASITDGKLKVEKLAAGTYTTTLTITFTDGNDIKTAVTLPISVKN